MTETPETTVGIVNADAIQTCFAIPNGRMTILPTLSLKLPGGRVCIFDWHRYLGPTFLRKDGEPLARYPSQRNPMWRVFGLWDKQGRRVDVDGACVWDDEPPEPKQRRRRQPGPFIIEVREGCK
jgi:hypothetical protein